jgi:hypothetical protein
MAYDFTATSSQYLTTASSPVSNLPISISLWIKFKNFNTQVAFAADDSSPTALRVQMQTTASNTFAMNFVGGGNVQITTSSAKLTNTWYHFCGTSSGVGANLSTVYFDGESASGNATFIGGSGWNRITIGARPSSATVFGVYSNAEIADVGLYNAALTSQEVASLGKGMTCDKVRPQSLVFYAPLVRDLIDAKGGLTITNNNGATVANHPRVYA